MTTRIVQSQLNVQPTMESLAQRRGRSNSLLKVEEVARDMLDDQSAYANINAEWVNQKGAWLIHPVLIAIGKIFIDTIPGMTQQISWTLVNLAYMFLSFLMFHWVTGIPFQSDAHGGAYDDLTLWEQIDEGAQYTPARKWLFCTPIVLFLMSTHYTHYDPLLFALNFSALLLVLLPKLPQFHRQRVRFLSDSAIQTPGIATPTADGSRTPKRMSWTPSPSPMDQS